MVQSTYCICIRSMQEKIITLWIEIVELKKFCSQRLQVYPSSVLFINHCGQKKNDKREEVVNFQFHFKVRFHTHFIPNRNTFLIYLMFLECN